MPLRTGGEFPYGASYSPLIFEESEWPADLRRMQEAGMNIVRIGDVHGSWDRLEPQKGVFRFELLERFYRSANEFGIQVLLSTGVACPPLWVASLYPDVVIVSNRGEPYPLAASYHWACIHNPGFLDEAERYVGALTRFAIEQPNHYGWQISNEIGFPFLPTREQNKLSQYCYCPHSRAHFCDAMQAKYGSLEDLSNAWMWSTTAYWYNEWSEIDPPEALPADWSGVTRWLDWRSFWQDAFALFARWQHDLIRRHDPDHPTSINTFNFKSHDRFGTLTGLDQWKLAAIVDHIGYDLYPGSGDKLSTRPEHNSMFLDHGRSVSQANQSDFWLHEIESGPIGGWILGPDHRTGPPHIWRNGIEALGHNSKLIIYMPWREWDYQPLRWGALVDLEGQPTERLPAAADLGKYIQKNTDFLTAAQVSAGEVALLESKTNAIFFHGVHQEETLFAAQRGAYRVLWEMGFRVDFITSSQLTSDLITAYKAICLPLMGVMSRETAEALRGYVNKGGVLIGFARCATVNDQGWYHRVLPLPELGEVFGLVRVEADDVDAEKVLFQDQPFDGALKRDLISPRTNAKVLAKFEDGLPAITMASYGEGHGLYFATHADIAAVHSGSLLLSTVLETIFNDLGIQPALRLEGPGKVMRKQDPHLIETQTRSTILISNSLEEPTTAKLHLTLNNLAVDRVEVGFIEQREVNWEVKENQLILNVAMRGKEGEVIDIYWQ